jgi:hypothetical protein
MQQLKNIFPFACLLLFLLPTAGFIARRQQHSLTLQFRHLAGSRELKLADETYTNSFGEPLTITRFKYYISHISIMGPDHKERTLSDKPYLVDESDTASKTLVFPFSFTTPQSLSFIIGVDSLLNTSGAQTGELDPIRGMFWTWNSGYIFAKLEGRSDSSPAPAHYLNWDVGGYKLPANAARKITLLLPPSVSSAADPVIRVDANLLQWFNGQHPLKISQHPLCHQPGALAMQIADNYSTMFSIAP